MESSGPFYLHPPLFHSSLSDFSPDGGSRWISRSSIATEDLNLSQDEGTFDRGTVDESHNLSMDKRSIQEEYRRLTLTKARRQRDARQY